MGDGEERFSLGLDVIINGLLATPTEGRLTPVAWEQQPMSAAVVRRQRPRRRTGRARASSACAPASSRPTPASRTSASPSRSCSPASPAASTTPRRPRRGSSSSPGECLAVIDGQEHPLRQWDYFHCPPGHPSRPRRRRRRPMRGAHGRRPAQRVAVGDPLPPGPRRGAPRRLGRRDDALLQAGLRRPHATPVRARPRRGPTPDACRLIVCCSGTARASQ